MSWLAAVLFIGIAVALLRGGRLGNLADIHLRAWWLLFLGFGMQAITNFFPGNADWARPVAVVLILLSYLALIALVWLNREHPGMWLAGVGILMNFSVIAANGGMPVMREAAALAGSTGEVSFEDHYKHLVLDEGARLAFLADVIPVALLNQVISLGDVFLAVGLAQFLEDQLRRPVRWFKHGVTGEAGSAVRTRR
ncbi:MAG: DUF5317 domain-containing protein [Actinomycetota bacterium]|nr:DUF5317 domain-containing protein [Actinomycetota bacterium]